MLYKSISTLWIYLLSLLRGGRYLGRAAGAAVVILNEYIQNEI